MTLYRGYEPARRCTGGPTSGARALMSWFLGQYGDDGGKNLGIYNCRAVAGSSTTSLHGEGRACDLGVNPHGAQWGTALADRLRLSSAALGVQCVIWNRRIWSGSYADLGFRAYTGTNPHRDHLHVELSRTAADVLTPARIHQILTGAGGASSGGVRDLRRGARGEDVRRLQQVLNSWYGGITVDSIFGVQTEAAVKRAQANTPPQPRLVADGVVGPLTRRKLGLPG